MRYYPTVGFRTRTDLISVIKYTLQDQYFRGSFTQEVLSNARGSILFDTEILSMLDREDIERINRTSKDLQFRFDDDYLVVQFLKDGNIVHTVALDEDSPYNESIVVGIEVVDVRKV